MLNLPANVNKFCSTEWSLLSSVSCELQFYNFISPINLLVFFLSFCSHSPEFLLTHGVYKNLEQRIKMMLIYIKIFNKLETSYTPQFSSIYSPS